jgi:hypothetical protein
VTGHAQALQVRSLKALTAFLDWNDVVNNLGRLQQPLGLAAAAKRVIP